MGANAATAEVSAGLVLMYHRVADIAFDPFSLAVSPAHFSEHLDVLKKNWLPTRLEEIVSIVRSGNTPKGMVAITFDDGYSDVFENARDLLRKFDSPATAFIVTGQIGSSREFMWDELERLLLQPGSLPERLFVTLVDQVLELELGEWSNYSEMAHVQYSGWTFEDGYDPTLRHATFRKLYYLLKYATDNERREVLEEILISTGAKEQGRNTHRAMTRNEILELSSEGLIDIGAHTVSHPVLAELAVELQRKEAQEGKSHLEEIIGRSVSSFAYPYGGPNDYTCETLSVLKDVGYSCACSTLDGLVSADSDIYQLPRIDIKDWDGDEFASRLSSLGKN